MKTASTTFLAALAAAAFPAAAAGQAQPPMGYLVERVVLCGVQRPLPLGAAGVAAGSGGQAATRAFARQLSGESWSVLIVVDGRSALPAEDAGACRVQAGDFSPSEVVLMLAGTENAVLVRAGLDGTVLQAVEVKGFFGQGASGNYEIVRTLPRSEAEKVAAEQRSAWTAYFDSNPAPESE